MGATLVHLKEADATECNRSWGMPCGASWVKLTSGAFSGVEGSTFPVSTTKEICPHNTELAF